MGQPTQVRDRQFIQIVAGGGEREFPRNSENVRLLAVVGERGNPLTRRHVNIARNRRRVRAVMNRVNRRLPIAATDSAAREAPALYEGLDRTADGRMPNAERARDV